ncbi:ABC transporter permease [Schaalia sp. ZJ405]|uniref:ABC transporter permease n=1 Tax=Schaalia sp. ZJ405 TaxID=2709403 RepID=UPI0013EB197B|nr:ABC transporter permease [Schaalia sp. ZJ405]QPK80938.1 ABC transporter permease [Schaalia sp. ZJ405]
MPDIEQTKQIAMRSVKYEGGAMGNQNNREQQRVSTAGKLKTLIKANYITILLVLICVILGALTSSFLSPGNISNVLFQSAFAGIAAMGMMLLISAGLIDLSVGGQIAICSIILARILPSTTIGLAILAVIFLSLILGLINGILVSAIKIPPFIATLGSLYLFLGFAYIYTDGQVLSIQSKYFRELTNGSIFGIPIPFICFIVIAILTFLLFRHSYFGRNVRAVGSNERAAYLAGVPVRRVKILAFLFASSCFSVSSIFIAGRLSSAEGNMAIGYEMTVIAAVIIGGTSMRGGNGNVWGTFVGAVLFTILGNALNLLGVASYWQYVVTGLILIAAISIGTFQLRTVPLRSEV